MATLQRRTASRLLRRALEAVLAPKNHPQGAVDAVTKRVTEVLPCDDDAEHDARLRLPDVEVERVAPSGRDPRRRYFPSTREFDPYPELFGCRRVTVPPWDTAWKRKPLILRDAGLLHAFDFPPFVESEPHEFGDAILEILKKHEGPVRSLRVDASMLPPPGTLGEWLDQLSAQGARELVLLDVGAPPAPDRPRLDFPMDRIRCPGLSTLALGFVGVRFGWCLGHGLSGLQELLLVSCGCTGRGLSTAVAILSELKKLGVLAMDLAPAGAGAAADAFGEGKLEINSDSLLSLELMEATATALELVRAPALQSVAAGVFPPEVKNPRVRSQSASPPVRISVTYAPALQSICGLVLFRRQSFNIAGTLDTVDTLQAELAMGEPDQWSRVLDLAAHLPALRSLDLTRADHCCADEHLQVEPVPNCVSNSLQQLILRGYRAGGAEVSLVTTVLAAAHHLASVKLYPHSSHPNPQFADRRFINCARLSPAVRIEIHQTLDEIIGCDRP